MTANVNLITVILLCCCVAGFFIRVTNLNFLTLWVDEFVHVNRARHFPAHPLLTNDNNGILYTIFIIPLFKLFEVNEFWARFPSVVLGTLSIPLIYLFGKKYFNKYVGLFAAILLTFSQYHIFWSRIARNYVIFSFFFLLLAYFLGKCLNVKDDFKPSGRRLFDYLHCTPLSIGLVLLLLILSVLSHQLALLVVYVIGFYHFVTFLISLFGKKRNFLSVNAIIAYIFTIYGLILFVPAFQEFVRGFLAMFLPSGIVEWVIPKFERILQLTKEKPFEVFNIYWGVVKTDYSSLYLLGLLGAVLGVLRFKNAGWYNLLLFAVPFLLMSFLFREPSLPRYLIYVYPFYLCAIALVFSELVFWFNRYVEHKQARNALLLMLIVSIVAFSPAKSSWAMVTRKAHGQVVPKELSVWYFPDWKFALKKIGPMLKDEDVVLSTMSLYPNFYLNRDVVFFRQRYYNTKSHAYENLLPDTTTSNASSVEALVRLYSSSKSGWLLADYYFNNVMTDPAARDFVIRNSDLMYSLSNEYVKVFHWDHSQPRRHVNTMAELLTQAFPATFEYSINLPDLSGKTVEIILEAEGMRYDNELLVVFNNRAMGVPLKSSRNQGGGRQTFVFALPANLVKVGENKVHFAYNTNEYRYNKNAKVAVYSLNMQWR